MSPSDAAHSRPTAFHTKGGPAPPLGSLQLAAGPAILLYPDINVSPADVCSDGAAAVQEERKLPTDA